MTALLKPLCEIGAIALLIYAIDAWQTVIEGVIQ